MKDFLKTMLVNGNLVDIISCIFTVMALVFTLYFWLLDKLSEDETEFIKRKSKILETLQYSFEAMQEAPDAGTDKGMADSAGNANAAKTDSDTVKTLLDAIVKANKQMEIILNYRFWARGRQREEFAKVNTFYQDTRYAISTMQRFLEKENDREKEKKQDAVTTEIGQSLVAIPFLGKEEIDDIREDYRKGLAYTIEFIENWT